ncbi:unnamed protein product, partial [Prunus brigantina]
MKRRTRALKTWKNYGSRPIDQPFSTREEDSKTTSNVDRSFSNREDPDEDLVPEVTHDVSEQLQNTTPYALPSSHLSRDDEAFEWQDVVTDPRWDEVMAIEMEALNKNSTWEMKPLPQGKTPIGCRWIFTIKYKVDGSIDRYKARLVAKGYMQTYGIDYQETFALVPK